MVDPNTRQGKRTPVTLKIKFKSETLEQFIERYAVDVSQGGIFIRTKEPLAVGTQMKFEFQLRDASPLIAGEGTVVWTRENDPSRPAIAPGMGVRFDRLADGSQGILERILTEKAKQAPQRPASDTAKPPLFTDTPTRVAPAPVQDALLGKDNGRGRRADEAQLDSHTPLPKPMPFHSDADEFPDEAFEEATKVRALDELIAQTADAGPRPEPRSESGRVENTSRGARSNGRADATLADPAPERPEPPPPPPPRPAMVLPSPAEPQEVPDLPNPIASPAPRLDSLPDALAKTRLGVEPARARMSSTPPPPMAPLTSEIPPLPSGMRAVAHEQTEPARMPELKSRSMAPLLIVIFLAVAAAGAAVWFFVLRPQVTESHGGATPSGGSAGSSATTATGTPAGAATGSGSANVEAATSTPPATGSAASPTPAAGSAAPVDTGAKPEVVETEIVVPGADGAAVEVIGASQQGPAPFTAKLERGKPYKVRITARGFATSEIDIKGGDAKQTAKLVAKHRSLAVTSDPSGAQISIDGNSTGKTTPAEIELTPAQAAKKSVHVVLRKSGFRAIDRTIDITKYDDADSNTRLVAKIDEKLAPAPVVPRPPAGSAKPGGTGSDTGGPGSDSGAAPAGGSPQGGSSDTAAPATPPPAPAPTPPSGGSAEPEPDFNKPK